MSDELYRLPLYYDIAFSWDIASEVEWFGALFREHVPFHVRNMLEPACGAGRFLAELPKHGYRVTGYDSSDEMLDYARGRIESVGDPGAVALVKAEMQSARFPREFDAALNSINSLGYLLEDGDIVSHFRLTGEALKPGGVYIVHISTAWDDLGNAVGESWEIERDGVRVKTRWEVEREDYEARRSHQRCTMEIDDHGESRVLVQRHELRLCVLDELKELAERCGTLVLEAIYGEGREHERLPLDSHINGEMGNHYYVLKAK